MALQQKGRWVRGPATCRSMLSRTGWRRRGGGGVLAAGAGGGGQRREAERAAAAAVLRSPPGGAGCATVVSVFGGCGRPGGGAGRGGNWDLG